MLSKFSCFAMAVVLGLSQQARAQETPKYQRFPYYWTNCPDGFDITTQEECNEAIASLGVTNGGTPWTGSRTTMPRFCMLQKNTDSTIFNTDPTGEGRRWDLAPVCKWTGEESPPDFFRTSREEVTEWRGVENTLTVKPEEWDYFLAFIESRNNGFSCPCNPGGPCNEIEAPGRHYHPPNPATITFDCTLWIAAWMHAEDQCIQGYFSHDSRDGFSPRMRCEAVGAVYKGEHQAGLHASGLGALQGLQTSPGHCNSMFDPSFLGFAAAHGARRNDPRGDGDVWTVLYNEGGSDISDSVSCIPPGWTATGEQISPTVPSPTAPAPTVPTPTAPAPTVPTPTAPAPTVPTPTVPAPTVPTPTAPAPTVPTPTAPAPTVPTPTAPAPEPTTPTSGPPSDYQVLDYGEDACPEGLEILSESECGEAIAALGITNGGTPWTGSRTTMPQGCSLQKETDSKIFNTGEGGLGRHDLAPVCKSGGAPEPPSNYQKLDYGDNACPEGLEILSESECGEAITALGITNGGTSWTGSRTTMPQGCSLQKETDSKIFNTGEGGSGRHDLAPVCKSGVTPEPPSDYQKLDYGEDACPDGLEILSETECSDGIAALGVTNGGTPWTGSRTTMPQGCSLQKDTDSKIFNTGEGGSGRHDLAPVCKSVLVDDISL